MASVYGNLHLLPSLQRKETLLGLAGQGESWFQAFWAMEGFQGQSGLLSKTFKNKKWRETLETERSSTCLESPSEGLCGVQEWSTYLVHSWECVWSLTRQCKKLEKRERNRPGGARL